ncbi:hemin-degrading factor [Aureimonas sp. D3]|uniref:hemin-degrading factor n=1 Tax=Aureimonas sp. D3 TaxID=1638164 RepID=UPI00078292A5|nr:hemin-degrading factor [Aureimonas sp. D3]
MDTLSDPTTAGATPFYATGKRSRDLAAELGLTEADLLARHRGPEVVRLRLAPKALVEALPALGEVMVLTRNDAAVHEKVGTFGQIRFGLETGLALNPPIDLRLFPRHWRAAFAVETPHEAGSRRSVQIFDAAGDAVIKVHLRATSSLDAFEALRTRFAAPKAEPLDIAPYPATSATQAGDPAVFRAEFSQMRDVHEFFPLLRRHGLDRRAALRLLGQDHVQKIGALAATRLLEDASATGLPIMCFVGNRGCIQIHTGPVETIRAMGPWINVVDPGFNLHLREDLVAEAFAVRKPTRHSELTSVELYDARAELIAQFYGVRDEDGPEDPRWRALVTRLGAGFSA